MSIIECLNLKKTFKNSRAINDLSFNIEENKITGLIGRNGAGKTTLLKLIAGYYRPTQGEVKVFSRNPFNDINVSANLIFVDDHMSFPSTLTLSDVLKSAGSFYGNWDNDLAFKLLDYFSLHLKQVHNRLSKGMQSTFNTIIGLASRCPITIFDEPTTGMDAAVRKDFYRALLKDYVEKPRTILLSSHLLNETEHILEDTLLINNGAKCLHLPITELRDYAIGLRGSAHVLTPILNSTEVIHREDFAPDNLYIVIKNNISESKIQEIKKSGITASAVSTEDLCVYLTAKTQGGIDDVFCRD